MFNMTIKDGWWSLSVLLTAIITRIFATIDVRAEMMLMMIEMIDIINITSILSFSKTTYSNFSRCRI